MDDVDATTKRAEVEENFRTKERKRIAKKRKEDQTEDCVECTAFISPQRQEATGGTMHCVECAEYLDR